MLLISNYAGGVAHYNCIGGHVVYNHRAGADHGHFANCNSGKNSRICADACAGVNVGLREFFWVSLTPREEVIGECRVWTNKDIIRDTEAVPQLHTAFYRDAIANNHIIFDKNMVTDIAVGS